MTGWKMRNKNNNNNDGLRLTIVNALTADWTEYFDKAIEDWDNGVPDVLSLSTTTTTADSERTPLEGKMKVCNGDYGNTGWKGINEMLTQSGYIVASVAKMNEHYLGESVRFTTTTRENERQYTMCHEIGHG